MTLAISKMEITKHLFGKLNNVDIVKYSILDNNGFRLDILNYGGIVTGIWLPDRNGHWDNIVLNYPNCADYLCNAPYLGAIIGRSAGRIANANFKLDGAEYKLTANNGTNNLHGGLTGLAKRIWSVTELNNGIKLSYFSPHLEDGFPGNVLFEVFYQITGANQIKITATAVPDRPTLINLTNHSYFNLNGNSSTNNILNHELQINADFYADINRDLLPQIPLMPVIDTPFDFNIAKPIGHEIRSEQHPQFKITGGYDHPFLLNKQQTYDIYLSDELSGRSLHIKTSEKYVVFYSGNHLPQPHTGLCLETQYIPNAVNLPDFKANVIYTPEKPYTTETVWQFGLTPPTVSPSKLKYVEWL